MPLDGPSIMQAISKAMGGGPQANAAPQEAPAPAQTCKYCGKPQDDPYQAAGANLSKAASGPSGQAFMANNPFK